MLAILNPTMYKSQYKKMLKSINFSHKKFKAIFDELPTLEEICLSEKHEVIIKKIRNNIKNYIRDHRDLNAPSYIEDIKQTCFLVSYKLIIEYNDGTAFTKSKLKSKYLSYCITTNRASKYSVDVLNYFEKFINTAISIIEKNCKTEFEVNFKNGAYKDGKDIDRVIKLKTFDQLIINIKKYLHEITELKEEYSKKMKDLYKNGLTKLSKKVVLASHMELIKKVYIALDIDFKGNEKGIIAASIFLPCTQLANMVNSLDINECRDQFNQLKLHYKSPKLINNNKYSQIKSLVGWYIDYIDNFDDRKKKVKENFDIIVKKVDKFIEGVRIDTETGELICQVIPLSLSEDLKLLISKKSL